jgi:hypothetical protein
LEPEDVGEYLPSYGVWDLHEGKKFGRISITTTNGASFEIVSKTDAFEKRVEYANSEGHRYSPAKSRTSFFISSIIPPTTGGKS